VLHKLVFSAMTFELGALVLLLKTNNSLAVMWSYLLIHAFASVLLALGLVLAIPRQYRKPRRWVLIYLFAFNFFMPIVGLLCATLGLIIGYWLPRLQQQNRFDTTITPRFTTHRNHEGIGFRGGQVRAQLGNAKVPLEQRLKALVAVQDTPARITGTLLRDLLADPAEDIRLLAYGILDNKEKQITQRILEYRERLAQVTDRTVQADLYKRLAELYWELIYQNLVQGDMQKFSAEQARLYAGQSLALDADDAGLWFMLARLELHAGHVAAAEHALQEAQKGDFARERLLPYYAEMRFLQKRFTEVRGLFAELIGHPGVPALAQVRRYWLSPTPVEQAATMTNAGASGEKQFPSNE
jgi:polysaccharide biosynthesis protein PelE